LDHQKIFHDVNYEHRLRDSVNELYQFKQHINHKRPKRKLSADSDIIITDNVKSATEDISANQVKEVEEEEELPNGVFTVLTDCYSSTCSTQSTCYSVLCPRRFNQVCEI
jgi:hypothetical protein